MRRTILVIFLTLGIFPISSGFSQELTDTAPTLGLVFTSFTPFNFKADDGSTVIIGEIENTKNFPVTGVKIWAGFYDDFSEQPLESTLGTTILEVIPPHTKSPYMIKSPSTNAAITSVSVNLLGFNSAIRKEQMLTREPGIMNADERVTFSGTISNNGAENTSNTKIYLAFYDAFDPPRIVFISSKLIEEEIVPDSIVNFEFDEERDSRAVGFTVFAESDNYLSNFADVPFSQQEPLTKLVTISDVSINDAEGNKLSDATVGSTINIQSKIWLKYAADQDVTEQHYVYFTQVKQTGEKAFVEFIGTHQGKFENAGTQFPNVEWAPEKRGLYFIETFVWDLDAIPLASKGPVIIVLVN